MQKSYKSCPEFLKDLLSRVFPSGEYNYTSLTFQFDKTRTVVLKLAGDRIARQYEGVLATLYSKQTGEIAHQYFPFNDYLEIGSTSNPEWTRSNTEFHVWNDNAFYINQPTDNSILDFCNAIDNWLAQWK